MTRLSISSFGLTSFTSLGLAFILASCSSDSPPGTGGTAGTSTGTVAGSGTTGGNGAGNTAGNTGTTGGNGTSGSATGTGGGSSSAGTPATGTAGNNGTSGSGTGTAGDTGTAGTGGGDPDVVLPPVVTSDSTGYWKTTGMLTDSTAAAMVTVNDAMVAQTWEGFGGAFNELGWSYLTTAELQAAAMKLLFDAKDGANLLWGRIPMGASDYAIKRYTLDDPSGTDPTPNEETGRPAPDTALSKFSLSRDEMTLIPFIKAAQAVKANMRFWASPWTPPIWMKMGYAHKTGSSTDAPAAVKPSYFDGGSVPNTAANFTAYAEYYKKFVTGYKDKGINIEIVSPQNEPGYSQNYPSALWSNESYIAWIKALGPVMQGIGVKVMLGTLSNAGDPQEGGTTPNDLNLATAVMADPTAKTLVSVAGVQWGVLGKIVSGSSVGGLPIWATEHKCGNYPWNPSGYPAYNKTQAPNDLAYGVESWGYIRDAIVKGKVTSYAAWNMVLDKNGLGNDLSRDWRQNSLLVVDGGKVNPTPFYYVFRHFSQYVQPMAKVVGTTGGDAVAFKNPDNSLVAVMYNSGAANPAYVVSMGGKTFQFAMPANGWATVKYKP
jgi:glucosylceramidase